MRKWLIVICVVALMLTICSCAENTQSVEEQVELFVRTAENINTMEYSERGANLEKLGLRYTDSTPVLTKEFFTYYLSMYTTEDFVVQFNAIANDDNFSKYSTHAKVVFDAFVEASGAKVISCHPAKLNECTGDFYRNEQNMYADPIPENSIAYGKFYSSTGENVNIQSRESTEEVEIYGDFALLISRDYDYNQGAYEWRNGVFYDQLPNWDLTVRRHLYYKGHHVCPMGDFTDTLYIADGGQAYTKHYGVLMTQYTPSGTLYYTFKLSHNRN